MKENDPVQIELLEDGNLKICPVPKSDQDYQGTRALTTTSTEKRQQRELFPFNGNRIQTNFYLLYTE